METSKSREFKSRSQSGENIWNPIYSTLVIVNNIFEQKLSKLKLGMETKKMCKAFFYSRLQCMDLKGTIDYEVEKCIDEAIIYVTDNMGKNKEIY
jgi:hypothetical protein